MPLNRRRKLAYEPLEQRQLFAVLTVVNTNDSGTGSLRDAIDIANQDLDADTIQFAIPGSGVRSIALQSQLPGIFTPMTIDGWSQSGFAGKPIVQIKPAPATQVDYGIQLFSNDNIVRGLILSGFRNSHLTIWGGDNNKVQGSYFGVNSAGTALEGGNTIFDAVFVGSSSVNNILGVDGDGVLDSQERNIVGGGQSGIGVWGPATTGNRVAGNYIGTNASGAKLPNQFAGVWLDSSATGNFVGSNNDNVGDGGEGNIIANNGTHGIVIQGAGTINNRISRNAVYDNALMEIDLANNGPDAIDNLDADTGPNGLANRPELTALTIGATSFTVSGSLTGLPSTSYRVELFSAPTFDPSGFGGAQKFVSAITLTTNASGIANFTRTINAVVDFGWVITATAIDSLGNSSEFSAGAWDGLNLAQTFSLSSFPTATKTIYLDFTGHTTTGTLWNTEYSQPTITTPVFSLDGSTAFSNAELLRIQSIFQRVSEDFRPFNVNVTTQEPPLDDLINNGGTDTRWGVRVAIGGAWTDWLGSSAGGVGYLNSFNWNSDTPAFVFPINNNNSEAALTSDAIAHEVGHTLGLTHDGDPLNEYYPGHGSGGTSWNTIMGGGSSSALTQWSRGQYLGANNTQDDLAIITTQNGFGYRTDDYGNAVSAAAALGSSAGKILQTGVISTSTDRDFFFFETSGGAIDLRFDVAEQGPNLDIFARIYDAAGVALGSNNPADQLSARITRTLTAGRYYISVDGVGKGTPLTVADGYTDYGSLGYYAISGVIAGLNVAPVLSGLAAQLNYSNNSSSTLVATAATVTDPDSSNFLQGVLTVSISDGADSSNLLNIATGAFTRSGRNVLHNGTIIGTLNASAGVGLTSLQITLGNVARSVVQDLVRAITFRTTNNTNLTARRLNFTLTDGDGGTSNVASVQVNIV